MSTLAAQLGAANLRQPDTQVHLIAQSENHTAKDVLCVVPGRPLFPSFSTLVFSEHLLQATNEKQWDSKPVSIASKLIRIDPIRTEDIKIIAAPQT